MWRAMSAVRSAFRSPRTCWRTGNSFIRAGSSSTSYPQVAQYRETLRLATEYFAAHGSSVAQAERQAFAWIGQQVQTQAAFLAYIDVFWTLMLVAAAAVPLALILRNVKLGAAAPAAH